MMKRMNFLDNLAVLYIFVMTFVVSMSIAITQSNKVNLTGENLWGFLLGFWGSIVCILVRFVIAYVKIVKQDNKRKKYVGIAYLTFWEIVTVAQLLITLHNANYSIDYQYLSAYNSYQFSMLMIMLAQWVGVKVFEEF